MEKEILLNDQGYKYKIIIDKDDISFDFDKSISFLDDLVKVENINNSKFVYIGLRKILRITNESIDKILPISTTEIKLLRAIYNHKKGVIKSRDIIGHFKSIKENIDLVMHNYNSLNKKGWNDKQELKTELHTHLIDILNPSEFIDFLNKFNITYPVNQDGDLDLNSEDVYTYKELVINEWDKKLIDKLRINTDNESNFVELESINKLRRNLLKRCIDNYELELSMDKEWSKIEEDSIKSIKEKENRMLEIDSLRKNASFKEKINLVKEKTAINDELTKLKNIRSNYASSEIYNQLLDCCLEKLRNEKIEYSEISFSNENKLKYMSDKHKDNKDFKLLLSIDRMKSISRFADISKNLEAVLDDGVVLGVEITGFEHSLEEIDYNSFKEKLEWLLPVLHIHPNSVLKIHAGEFKDSTKNILNALKAIKETENKINESCSDLFGEVWGVLPPPRIRIGHSVNICDNKELVDLLKEFDAVIEYNVSSNYSFNSNQDLNDLPLKYYEDNNIKYILASDGGGLFSTSIKQEQNIINNLQTTNIKPTRQEVKIDFVKNAKETEKEIVNESKNDIVSKKDKDLMNKYLSYKEENDLDKKVYSSYQEAMEDENKLFRTYKNKDLNEIEKVKTELSKIKRYINDNDVDIDEDYYNTKIGIIEKYSKDKYLSEYAKMYLFLLEKELFPEIDSSFITIEYLSTKYDEKDRIEEYLRRVFLLVSEQYVNDSEEYYRFNNHKK